MIERIYVARSNATDAVSEALLRELNSVFGLKLKNVKKIVRYDIEDLDPKIFEKIKLYIFGNNEDELIYTPAEFLKLAEGKKVLPVELLDGQYDIRADGISNCLQIYTKKRLKVKTADIYLIDGANNEDFERIKTYLFNPLDSRLYEAEYESLEFTSHDFGPARVEETGFIERNKQELKTYHYENSLAMTIEDLEVIQEYFSKMKRDPTITEIKVIDTYWSDHCRHTTFLTEIVDVEIKTENPQIQAAFDKYVTLHKKLFKNRDDKYLCLMDLATIAARFLKEDGILTGQEISDEINACSVKVTLDNDGADEKWLIMFKNETHNHPTEMEPYGGAATCLGGAIRDPLSGRSFVYQAMRITGAGNILEDVKNTLPNKLSQRQISKTAMRGYSSYSNQIGVASGQLKEFFYDGYKAKRMEAGYVIAGSKEEDVVRKTPVEGDVILLVGGETGRDGIGGATGSSRTQTQESFKEAGAEVQKGNAAEEKKIMRLYNNPIASKMIIRSNDFGAGGVSVAIGELADGLDIYLDRVPLKYPLSATEIAISESQERMAVVLKKEDMEEFVKMAQDENLLITHVATVTALHKMRLFYKNEIVVDLDRSFLNTNGAKQIQKVSIASGFNKFFGEIDENTQMLIKKSYQDALEYEISKLNNCSQKGLSNNFDHTVGGLTVLAPYGGKKQMSPTNVMASKPPVDGFTRSITCSSYGLYPNLMLTSPYVGAMFSVIGSISKLIASGVKYESIYMSFQEYFKRLAKDPIRWGEPLEALLGAFIAQMELELGSIGGKDSMSGSYENIDVPPTLISFATGMSTDENIIHSSFPEKGNLYLVKIKKDQFGNVDFQDLKPKYLDLEQKIIKKIIVASAVVENNLLTTLSTSLFGNSAGATLDNLNESMLFGNLIGDIIVVSERKIEDSKYIYLGSLSDEYVVKVGDKKIDLNAVEKAYTSTLEEVYPSVVDEEDYININVFKDAVARKLPSVSPNVLIPVFLGTVGERELRKSFERAGAKTEVFVLKTFNERALEESIMELAKHIKQSQIFAFSDSLVCGDEFDGSGKYSSVLLSLPKIHEALLYLLEKNDGLILGLGGALESLIKNGFIKANTKDSYLSLSSNTMARYISAISTVNVSSVFSPWMSGFRLNEKFQVPISTGKGQILTDSITYSRLVQEGQVATQFVNDKGVATYKVPYNPTGSNYAIESLSSIDGKVLGKLGHVERYQPGLYRNLDGNFNMHIFENGVKYFS